MGNDHSLLRGIRADHLEDCTEDQLRSVLQHVSTPHNAITAKEELLRLTKAVVHVVYINVYDLIPRGTNALLGNIGFGMYHSGVILENQEWAFGGIPPGVEMESNATGVFICKPGTALPLEQFHSQLYIGTIFMRKTDLHQILYDISKDWTASSYHLFTRNCNHFADTMLQALNPNFKLPRFINRAARVSWWLLPNKIILALTAQTLSDVPNTNTSNTTQDSHEVVQQTHNEKKTIIEKRRYHKEELSEMNGQKLRMLAELYQVDPIHFLDKKALLDAILDASTKQHECS